jgi:hypothetical protein
MRTRPWLQAAAFIGLLAGSVALSYAGRWGLAALVLAALAAFVLSRRCTHRFATLLPPVRDAGPERDHARWYCDRCGHTWDAGLESNTRPRVIFDGYDENKAVRAAARAEALDKQRRRLATKRGTTRQRPVKPASAARPGPRRLQTMLEQRAVGFADDARPYVAARRARE